MAPGEAVEVGALLVRRDVLGDDLDPGAGDRVVILLRCSLVRTDVPDPAADLADGRGHAVALDGQESQVDVLAVPELAVGPGDRGQDRGELGASRAARVGGPHVVGRRVLVRGHQQASCRAVMTAW
jgi:hypothetical protein